MLVAKKLYTVEEFEQFLADPANQERRFELIHGEIVEKMPTEEHGLIAANILSFLWNYAKPRKLGRGGMEIRHGLPEDTYNDRLPDIAFNRDLERPVVEQGSVPKMPDLAVDVKSPSDSYRKLREKADYYLQNGSKLAWLVYPEKHLVEVYRPDADSILLTAEDTLDGGEVLPGFTLPVQAIFDVD